MTKNSHRRHGAFTLIELIVSVGLMAVFMSMVATIFFQTTTAFTGTRSAVQIHQNSRAAFDIMLRDLSSSQLCSYEDKIGYFALSWENTSIGSTDTEAVQALTFTTLASQPGAKPLVPGVSPQVALVRYVMEWDGGTVDLEGDDPTTATQEAIDYKYTRRTFNLMKKVRFPQLAYYFTDMGAFPSATADQEALMPDESLVSDILAIGVIDMRLRIYHQGRWIDVSDHGTASAVGGSSITDDTKTWTINEFDATTTYLRIPGGNAAPQNSADITSNSADTLSMSGGFNGATPNVGSTYRIEEKTFETEAATNYLVDPKHAQPKWARLDAAADSKLPMIIIESTDDLDRLPSEDKEDITHLPYLVEVTLTLVDAQSRNKRIFTFTQRFAIPTANWREQGM
jgi:type II secretory pathway pseudopilin PulG